MAGLQQASRPGGRSATAHRAPWWERAQPIEGNVDPLRAVIFDLDSAMADIDGDGDKVARSGLIDLVMSLFVAGIWVGVVSSGRRAEVDPLVRELVGDGLVETIVTADDLPDPDGPTTDLYKLALWEFGIRPESALAVVGTAEELRTAADSGLATVVVPAEYDGPQPLLASSCQRLHQRWWATLRRAA